MSHVQNEVSTKKLELLLLAQKRRAANGAVHLVSTIRNFVNTHAQAECRLEVVGFAQAQLGAYVRAVARDVAAAAVQNFANFAYRFVLQN